MRYPNSKKATGTMIGKHDLQHQQEMNDIFKGNGVDARASFERLRGLVTLVVQVHHIEKAEELFLQRYPDFKFKIDEFPQGTTHFRKYHQTI
jgi:hypothetical protein